MTEPASPLPAVVASDAPRPWLDRLAWLVAMGVSWPVVVLSTMLRPDPRGFGTHQQLGLPPCTFESATGVPCPGCGLTTSFAHMAHLQVLGAFRAHLMGPCLFVLTLGVALVAPWALRRALPVQRVLAHPSTVVVLGVTLAAGVVTFALRLFHAFVH